MIDLPAPPWGYFLDLDGTLVDLAETPGGALAPADLSTLLARLHAENQGAVALVSGRPIAELDAMLGGLLLPAAGLHGLERRTVDGRRMGPPPGSLHPEPAWDALTEQVARHPGLLAERKGVAFAIHYRRAPQLAGYAHRLARAARERLGTAYEIQGGKRVVELRPVGADKGDAVRAFLAEPAFRDRTPVFIGDDRTDEAGFAAVDERGGISIKVGPGPSRARWRLVDARAVRDWLLTGQPRPRRSRRRIGVAP
jgi:trehalose 6-phosphate phosphatase